MPNFVIDTKRYAIYVKVLEGEADGTLIYIDSRGHMHVVGPGDPVFPKDRLAGAVEQIEAGMDAALAATAAAGVHQ